MKRLLVAMALLVSILGISQSALAWSPFAGACSAGGGDSAACNTGQSAADPFKGSNSIFVKVEGIIAIIAGLAAVIMIIIGAFRFVTAGGDAQKVAAARGSILHACIGLAVIVLAQGILTFIVGKVSS